MENKVLLVEYDSLTKANLRKLLAVCGLTEKDVVEYKKGALKPELISTECNYDQIKDEILSELFEFLSKHTSSHTDYIEDIAYIHKTIYYGSKADFMAEFIKFLDRNKG